MSNNHRLPIHVGDYMKDTPAFCRHSWEHHGIYMIALMLAWNTPRGRLPNDPQWLSLRFGCTVEEYETNVRPVLLSYFKNDGNFFTQKRLISELNRVRKIAKTQTERRNSRKSKENKPKTNPRQTGDGFVPPTPPPPPGSNDPSSPPSVPPEGNNQKSKRGTRLADHLGTNGTTPPCPPEFRTAAADLAANATEQWPRFYDYWLAQPGQKGVKLDWLATWRNWCRKSVDDGSNGRGPPPQKLGRVSQTIFNLMQNDGWGSEDETDNPKMADEERGNVLRLRDH